MPVQMVTVVCSNCGGSDNIVKDGMRELTHGLVQRYRCNDCDKRFVFLSYKPRYDDCLKRLAVYYYTKCNMSSREVRDIFHRAGMDIHHTTVIRWVNDTDIS